MKLDAKTFKDYLLEELKNNPKTSWGKNELASYIYEVYANYLELVLTTLN